MTGELTRAVRTSTADVGEIAEGDWIGLARNVAAARLGVGDGIVAVDRSLQAAAFRLLDVIVHDAAELVTVITGEDATSEDTSAIASWLSDEHADVAVEVHAGGQPLYPYLFGVE